MDIIARIMELGNGDILNTMQAANELPGTIEEKLERGYAEITA